MSVADTSLSTDVSFHSHLALRTPIDEAPLNWSSDDSETEQLMSTAEQLCSIQAQANNRPCFAMPAEAGGLTSFQVQPTGATFLAEEASGNSFLISAPLPEFDLANSLPYYAILSETIQETSRRLQPSDEAEADLDNPHLTKSPEPVLSNLTGEEYEVNVSDHDAVPVINLPVGDIVREEFNGTMVLRVPSSVLDALLSSQHRHNVRQMSEPTIPAVANPGDPRMLKHQASAPANLQEAVETISSEVHTPSHVPTEAEVHGARPKVLASIAPTPDPEPSHTQLRLIPIFVEEETLSEDELETDQKWQKDDTSSLVGVDFSRSVLQPMSRNLTVGSAVPQIPTLVKSTSTDEQPVMTAAGPLAKLDLRNSDQSVSTDSPFSSLLPCFSFR